MCSFIIRLLFSENVEMSNITFYKAVETLEECILHIFFSSLKKCHK